MFLKVGKQLVNLDNVIDIHLNAGQHGKAVRFEIGPHEDDRIMFVGREADALREFFDRAVIATRTTNPGSNPGPVVVNVPVPEP